MYQVPVKKFQQIFFPSKNVCQPIQYILPLPLSYLAVSRQLLCNVYYSKYEIFLSAIKTNPKIFKNSKYNFKNAYLIHNKTSEMIYFSKKIFHCLKMYFERYNLLHSTRPKTRFLVGISSSLVSSPSVYACYTCVDIADTALERYVRMHCTCRPSRFSVTRYFWGKITYSFLKLSK